MSLKAELETWALALKSYEADDLEGAIARFDQIADTSKICWNVGIILATLGRHEEAVERFAEATAMDGFFTVAYQQKGVSNFMLGRYEAAHKDFEDALLYLRGNQTINYEQLGLDFRLYSAEVLFNCGLTKIYLGQIAAGMADLREAQTQKLVAEHGVIDDAIRDEGRDYNVFSVPVGVLFRPSQIKLKNLAAKDYMGKAILVAASDVNDAYTTFTGITRLQRGQTPTGAPLDAGHPLGRSASVNAIPEPVDKTPIATRLGRSNTAAMSRSLPSSPPSDGALSRNLTTVRPTLRQLNTDVPPTSLKMSRPSAASGSTPPLSVGRSRASPPTRDNVLGVSLGPTSSGRESPLLRTPPSELPQPRVNTLRVTELYDDYYKDTSAYDDELANLPPIGGKKQETEAWARKTAAVRPGRSGSLGQRGAPPPSSFTGGRGLTRTMSRSSSGMGVSRDSRYEDDTASDAGSFYDMNKIRVKVHVGNLTRGMAIMPDDSFADFCSSLRAKFPSLLADINVRFRDEDGDELSMQDEGDFEAAVDVARVMAKGRAEGKLEIWVD